MSSPWHCNSTTALLGARGVDAGARQLSREISEEAHQVDAILSAMERIHDLESDGVYNFDLTPIAVCGLT